MEYPGLSLPQVVSRQAERGLVKDCQDGDRVALGRLYQMYFGRVYSVVRRMVGVMDAEEVCQEVFIKIFNGIARFRGDSGLGTWIYRLAVNASLSFLSRRKRQQDRLRSLQDLPSGTHIGAGPLDRLYLERALESLPPGYRAALILHDVEGLSHEEIGEVMGWHRGTSKSQLHKARARMRLILAGEGSGR